MNYSEDTIKNWINPPSDSEDEKLLNAERMVKDAITNDDKLSKLEIKVFCQGSYANNTNIRLDSDIDVNINYKGAFYYDLPFGMKKEDFGLGNACNYSYHEFKNDVETALIEKFGRQNVKRKNKCFTVMENSYRAEIDIVPTWKHRWYQKDGSYVEGVVLFANGDNSKVINYSLQHIENGKQKNERTQRRYKRLVRIFKKVNAKMEEDNFYKDKSISSFLLESLIWNCPDSIFNDNETWNDRIKEAIIFIYNNTKETSSVYKGWEEVSNLLYLFYNERKWTREAVNNHMIKMWNYMGYKND